MGKTEGTRVESLEKALSEYARQQTAQPYPAKDAGIPHIIDLLSRKGALYVLYALSEGPCRFNDLCRRFDLNPATLSERFSDFQAEGITIRKVSSDKPPLSYYCLTERGQKLARIFEQLVASAPLSSDLK